MNESLTELGGIPAVAGEFCALGLVRLPGWVEQGDRPPYRMWAALAAGPEAGMDMSDPVEPGEKSNQLLIVALVRMAHRLGHLPGQLHLWDAAQAKFMAEQVKAANLSLEVFESGKYSAIDAILMDMAGFGGEQPPLAGMLSGTGVTLDHVRNFAHAAADFCNAQPWHIFDSDEDLLRLEGPDVPPLLRHLVVLGRSGQEYGVGFYAHEDDFFAAREGNITPAQMKRQTRVFLSRSFPHELPFQDADLWEDHNLPLANGQTLLPAIIRPKIVERPDAATLALLEGILRALAVAREADLDAGAWSSEVSTAAGNMKLQFSRVPLPAEESPNPFSRQTMEKALGQISQLMAEGKVPAGKTFSLGNLMNTRKKDRKGKADPKQQAQELIYDAWDSAGRESVKLARRALELWPDAADAYNILAREFNSPQDALNLYAKGLAAAERALGEDLLRESRGHFWGILETRPYMRALVGLAHAQWISGQRQEAIAHGQRALDLNPGDNQGVRYSLITWLLTENQDREASALLKQYDESSCWWVYGRTLLAFHLGGDCPQAAAELRSARKENRYVIEYLTGKKPLPFGMPGSYAPGSREEAVLCARDMLPAWQQTPDAIAWLERQPPGKTGRKKKS